MDNPERDNELAAFEARLGAFRPGASRLDRDRVMYLAGRGAALKERRIGRDRLAWPSAFAAMTTVAAVLLVALVVERQDGGTRSFGPAVDLAHSTDSKPTARQAVQSTSSSSNPDHPTSDLDTLLAQLPTGRGLPQGQSWKSVDPAWAAEAAGSVSPSPPVTYVKSRQMLLEELLLPGSTHRMRTKS
ncbi:MAG: hypothetical protein GXX96_09430 [Planctomycetaceae bacterium]|jgi:hypothetical protein|nr:hypothetical protein [Planctomycetaceae bacterium]